MFIASSIKQLYTKRKHLTKKNFFITLLIIDLLITLCAVLKASSYSFMITDDFYDAVLIRDMFEGNLLYRTINVVYYRYMTHTGAFSCFFTLYFMLGLVVKNEALLSLFIVSYIILVILALALFINSLGNYLDIKTPSIKLAIFSGSQAVTIIVWD